MTDATPEPDAASAPAGPSPDDVFGAEPVRGRRRLAELGAGLAVAIGFITATMALGGSGDSGDNPGLPAPYETAAGGTGRPSGTVTTTGTPAAPAPSGTPQRPTSTGVYVPRGTYPSSTGGTYAVPTPTASGASVTVSPRPGTPTPPPATITTSPSASASSSTPTPSAEPTTSAEPTDPVDTPPPPPGPDTP